PPPSGLRRQVGGAQRARDRDGRFGWWHARSMPLQAALKSSARAATVNPVTATQPLLAIGEVAARVGIRTSALRYYEAQGLISPDARVGGRRRYRADAVDHPTAI